MIRTILSLAVCLTVSVLTGCVHFQDRAIVPASEVAEFQARTLADTGLRSYIQTCTRREVAAWPLPAWDFTNLVLAAFYYNPELDVARAKWALTQGGKVTAGERPNPSLSVAPAFNTTTPTPSPWLLTPVLDIPIETAGKRKYRLAQAGHLSEAARLNIAAAAWQVRSRVRRSLLEWRSAREVEQLLAEQQNLQAESLRLLERQFEAGAISAFEVTQARIAADSTRLAVRDVERQSAEARVQLADAIGIATTGLAGVEIDPRGLDQLPAQSAPAEVRHQALLNRADILGALSEYAASQAALQLEIAKQYPDIHLNPGYEFDQGDNKWSLGFSLTLPVLNQNRGAIAEAQAKRAEAAANFNALQAKVVGEIDRALASYALARQKQSDADALLANLRKQEKAAQAMFAAGEISRVELAALRLQLSASALTRADALAKAQLALAQLEDALQSPLGLPPSAWQISPRAQDFNSFAPKK